MKLYSYQGKQWVIRGEFASDLGIGRHDLERETRQRPLRRHVTVLRDTNRKAFLKANGLSRAGGPIALIEKAAAEQIEAKIKGKPVQTTLPFPAPQAPGKDRLQLITATFRGESRAFLELNGQRCVPVPVLGRLLGYRPPSELTTLIRREWKNEFAEGVDYALVVDENLNDFKACAKVMGITHVVRARTSQLFALYESGVNKVLLKTSRPDGVLVREFLAKEIMPALSREQPVTPKTFFLNEQHELPPQPKVTPTGMVSGGGLSDHGAERLHHAITLNTSFALADKLVQTGQLKNQDATAIQVILVKELGGVDIFAMEKRVQTERFVGLGVHTSAPAEAPKTVTYPAPPEKVPAPKAAILPKATVGEEWTLATNPDAVIVGEVARILSKDTGREISPGRVKTLTAELRIPVHYATKPRARHDIGPMYVRRQDIVKMHKHLLEHPMLFASASS